MKKAVLFVAGLFFSAAMFAQNASSPAPKTDDGKKDHQEIKNDKQEIKNDKQEIQDRKSTRLNSSHRT